MKFRNNLGEINPYQLITTFGPGAILDLKEDSVVILDPKFWPKNIEKYQIIKDDRLSSLLEVSHFRTPLDVPSISFPDFHVCTNSKCNNLFRVTNINKSKYDKNKKYFCPKCGANSYSARFVIICEDGHLDDFPWYEWIHHDKEKKCNCENLTLKTRGISSSLGDIVVKCLECGIEKNLSGITQDNSLNFYQCKGTHPQRLEKNQSVCGKSVKVSYKGATNVYFSNIISAISIPAGSSEIEKDVNKCYSEIKKIKELKVLSEDAICANPDITLDEFKNMRLNKLYKDKLNKYSVDKIEQMFSKLSTNVKFTKQDIKSDEYNTILNHNLIKEYDLFKAVDEDPKDLKEYFTRIIRIEKLREIIILKGFNRITMPDENGDNNQMVSLDMGNNEWLPGVQTFGEGIFLEFNKKTLNQWNELEEVIKKNLVYSNIYSNYLELKGWEKKEDRDANYILMHTLSHILIKKLGEYSGYTSTSIKERIYSSENMNGILIYVSTSDSEGSLGGLVELGKYEKFKNILQEVLLEMLTCNGDPICLSTEPSLADFKFNGASCHSCTLISETSCENGNKFLDRRFLLSLEENKIGYFDKFFEKNTNIKLK